NAKSAIFYPQANGKISGNYTVTYTYVDEKGCESSKDHKIEVIYLPAPSTVGFYAIASQNNPVIVEAEKTVGDGIVWFEYAASTSDEDKKDFTSSSANKYATGDNPNSLLNTKYYARQYKKGSNDATVTCYSESTPAEVVIMICPVPNVEIENVDSCVYNGNPILTAKPGEWLDADGSRDIASTTYRFYASADGKTYSSYEEGVTNTTTQEGTYEPNLTPTKNPNDAGYYYFYVSEYNAQPYGSKLTNPEGCESSPVKVTVNMKATLAPSISAISASSVCEGDENPSFRVAAEDAKALIYWYEEDEPNPNANGDVDTLAAYGKKAIYKPIGANVGENVVYAVQYVGGCFSPQQKITYTVKPNPVAPDPVENEICYQDLSNDNRVIEAVGDKEKGYSITWYRDNNKAKLLKANSDTYQPADTAVGTYYYYAMQTVDGCSGPVVPVAFTVKPLPVRPVIKEVSRKCTYDEPVLLEAEGMDVLWYAADKETVLNPDERSNTYQTQEEDTTAGKKVYYATQTVEGCEGPMAQVTYMIYKQPEKPNVVGASMCQGDTLVPTLSTDLLLDKWYADEDKETFLVSGYTYTPTVGANEYGNKYFYVQREQNGCFSPIAVDTLVIVQHPVITIEENRIMCVYEELQPIKVQDFVPAVNDRSSVVWRLKNGAVSKYIEEIEGEEHAVAPSDLITEEGTYEVYASYRYVYDNIYCQSDEVAMSIDVKGRARKPIVFTTTICAGDKIEQLRSLGSPNTTWESLDGTLPAEYHGQSYKFQPGQTLDTGVYRYIIYDMNMYDEENLLGCESLRDTVSMVVAPGANTKLFGRDSVCLGSVGETYYTQYESTSQYFWNVTGNNLNYSKDASATSVRYIDWMNVGIDTLTVYEQTWAGCEGFDTLIVRVAPAPIAKFSWTMPGASNIIELTDSTMQDSLWKTNSDGELVAEQIQYTLAWNYGHQGTSETQIDTIVPFAMRHYPLSEGNYLYGFNCPILTVTNDFGCSDTYTECIFVNISSSIYVPTAFSPTNPAHSVRTFQPKGFNLATCEVSVYDKWGNLLWYSDQVEDGIFVGSWDGRYDGKMMKSDVYVWKMEATFLDGQKWQGFDSGNGKKTKFGSVTLIR
ncbi:MAG: gliding motility-associated C-terminal domain-containing protein, partial [Bacteroidales bacterium]|nr:gliding motility-associated C-terminal domain-containing protein [Bacteroidales bacterium]